ncbi:unnamed protein product, partial [Durusdinium trenchii]
ANGFGTFSSSHEGTRSRLYALRVEDGKIDLPENASYKEEAMEPPKVKSKAKGKVLESLMILYNEGAGVGEELRKYAITEIR